MGRIWVVVADAGRARIFAADKPVGDLAELEALSNPEARLHEGELVSDRGGRVSAAGGAAHGYGQADAAKNGRVARFAAEVAQHIEAARQRHAFEKIYIIAAPAFLGLLRKQRSDALAALVAQEVASDLTRRSPPEIRQHLPQYL